MAPPRRARADPPTNFSPAPDSKTTGPVPHYYQQPQVQAQLRAQRGSIGFQDAAQFDSRDPRLVLPTMPPSHAGPASSPFPFPPSEHPLPPRASPLRRPGPQLSIPEYFPSYPQPQYFPSTPPQHPYPPPDQFSSAAGLYPPPVFPPYAGYNPSQSRDYRFPPGCNSQAQFAQCAQFTPPLAPGVASYHYQVPPHQKSYQNVRGVQHGGGGISQPLALTPFSPVPIRHFDEVTRPSSRPVTQNQHHQSPSYSSTGGSAVSQSGIDPGGGSIQPRAQFAPPGLPPPPGFVFPRNDSVTNEVSSLVSPVSPTPLRPPKPDDRSNLSPHPSSCASSARNDPALQLPSPPASTSHCSPDPTIEPAHSPAQTLSASPPPPPAVPSASRRQSTPTPMGYRHYPLEPLFTLPPPGGITPAVPRELLPRSPPMTTAMSSAPATCDVEGCPFPRFCSLSPCGDMICRDHLGTVIRRVQLRPKKDNLSTSTPHASGRGGGGDEMVKVFECVKCGKQSEMVGPTPAQQRDKLRARQSSSASSPHELSRAPGYEAMSSYSPSSQFYPQQQTATVGLGLDLGLRPGGESFSIHYFSHGPTGARGGGYEPRRASFGPVDPTPVVFDTGPGPEIGSSDGQRSSVAFGTVPARIQAGIVSSPIAPPQSQPPNATEAHEETVSVGKAEREGEDETESAPGDQRAWGEDDEPAGLETSQDSSSFTTTVSAVESQSVEPLSPSPPTCTKRKLPQVSTPTVPNRPTGQDAALAFELNESDSSDTVSSSPPSTPIRQAPAPAGGFDVSPTSPTFASPSSSMPSPRPTSEYFSNYSYSPRGTRLRGRGGSRGSRARGYDPSVHRWSPRQARHGSLSTMYEDVDPDWPSSPRGGRARGERTFEGPVAPEAQIDAYLSKTVVPELTSRFFVVKIENIPFSTTYQEIETWLPPQVLPLSQDCPQPIHILLHRVTGRTLPHCYVEIKDRESALLLMNSYDRSLLGIRTVRVKMARVGELMRDVFDQSGYFASSNVPRNLSQDPLPNFHPEDYRLPDTILSERDLDCLARSIAFTPWSSWAPRIPERGYTNLGTVLSLFPWRARPDLWDEHLRDRLFYLVCRAIAISQAAKGPFETEYSAIAERLSEIAVKCPAFTPAQRDKFSLFGADDFPPLSSPVESFEPASDTAFEHVTSTPRPASPSDPPRLSQSLPIDEKGSELEPGAVQAGLWSRWARSSVRSTASSTAKQESPTLYWAEEPRPASNDPVQAPHLDADDGPQIAAPIPSSAWVDYTPSVLATPSPADERRAAAHLGPNSPEYPLTPPDSPENTRPRDSSFQGEGGVRGDRGRRGVGGWKA
ncbi:hypothetical protein JCM11491_000666 [Sporobolomyces phaffii]